MFKGLLDGSEFHRNTFAVHRGNVKTHNGTGPTMAVSLLQDDPAMFMIRKESSMDLYASQQDASEDMITARPNGFLTFAWPKPEGSRYRYSAAARVCGCRWLTFSLPPL
jgi:hypothetical protein